MNSFDYAHAHPLEILFIRLVSKPSRIRPYFISHNALSTCPPTTVILPTALPGLDQQNPIASGYRRSLDWVSIV